MTTISSESRRPQPPVYVEAPECKQFADGHNGATPEDQPWQGWRATDINCGRGGLTRPASHAVLIRSGGHDLFGPVASFRFVFRCNQTPRELTAYVKQMTPDEGETKAGLMVRWGPADEWFCVVIYVSPDGSVAFASKGESSRLVLERRHFTDHAVSGLRFVRHSSEIEGFYFSVSEGNWISLGRSAVPAAALNVAHMGMIVCAPSANAHAAVRFEQIEVSPAGQQD